VGELAVLSEWALRLLEIVLAQLSFVLLLQSVELALTSVEIVVVGLLGEVTHDFAGWIIEISWPSICVETLTFIARLFARRVVELRVVGVALARITGVLVQISLLTLLWSLRIGVVSFLGDWLGWWRLRSGILFFFGFFLVSSVAHHFFKSFCL